MSQLDSGLLLPTLIVLTFIAVINSLQAFFIFQWGGDSTIVFLKTLAANLYYSLFYILMALAVRRLSVGSYATNRRILHLIVAHVLVMLALTSVHQLSSALLEKALVGAGEPRTLTGVLTKNPSVWGDFVVYVLFVLSYHVIESMKTSREHEIEYSRLEAGLVNSQLHELRARIHPQFLLDSIDSARMLAEGGKSKEASATINLLSEFLRTTVYDADRQERTLAEETAFARRYLEIEKARFQGRLGANLVIEPGVESALVPNFILQPLAEEMLRRNLENSPERYEIEITASKNGTRVDMVLVGNSDHGSEGLPDDMELSSPSKIIGDRLRQLYGNDHEFTITSGENGRISVKIGVPYATGKYSS